MDSPAKCPQCGADVNSFMLYCAGCNAALDLYYKQSREEFAASLKEKMITGVSISSADDEVCTTCRAYQGQEFTPDNLPRIPIDGCSNEGGCRCCYSPVIGI